MRKLAILTFVTLDGVMQSPKLPEGDTSNGFNDGGWADEYWDEVIAQVGEEAMNEPYDLLLGRKTYELFATNNAEESGSNPLNNYIKYVVTSSKNKLDWKNSIPITGNVVEEIAKLKSQNGLLLQVHGSQQLIQTLLLNDLIDEFRLWVFPVIVGNGKRLFPQGCIPNNLTFVKSKSTFSGVIMSFYQRK